MKKILCLVLSVLLLPNVILHAADEENNDINMTVASVRDVILRGSLLYSEDFENPESVREDIGKSIDGETVTLSDNALYVNSNGKAIATAPFGAEAKECIAEYDVKQLSCVGGTAANITFGSNSVGQASYCFAYSDISKYNYDTNALDGSAGVRDRLLIGKSSGSHLMDKWTYFGATDSASGALLTNGRKFEKFYTFRAAIAGKTALFEIFDGNTRLDGISVTDSSIVPSEGQQVIRMQNTEFVIDNIKVYEAKGLDSIRFIPDKSLVKPNETVGFKLVLGDGTQLDKRYFNAVEITTDGGVTVDKENCTFAATEEGEFTVNVLVKDYSDPQLTVESNCSLNVINDSSEEMTDSEAVKAARDAFVWDKTEADSDFELPSEGLYGTTILWTSNSNCIRIDGNKALVYCADEETDVTLTAAFKRGTETSVRMFTVTVPAIIKPDRDVILMGEMLFSEDFNDAEELDENIKSSLDGENVKLVDNALYIISNGKAIATAPFGAEAKECIAEYDMKQLSCVGNTGAHITFGTNSVGQASYCFAYSDVSKYNYDTNALDGSAGVRDRLLIGKSSGSHLMDKWTYFGATDSASGALLTNGRKFEKFYTFRAAIAGKTALFEIFDGNTRLDGISVTDSSIVPSEGQQVIRMQNTEFVIDNIKVYEAKGLDSIRFIPDKSLVKPDETVGFKLVLGDGTQLDKRYFNAVEITTDGGVAVDKENCTFAATEEGEFTVNVLVKDYSDPQLTVESNCSFTVSAAADSVANIADELKIEEYIDNYDSILEDFELPVEKNGAVLTWQSDSDEIVIEGNKATVTRGETKKEVILAVTVAIGKVSVKKQFKVTVEKRLDNSEIVERDIAEIKIAERTTGDIELPVNGRYGSTISWSSNMTSVISDNGKVQRDTRDRVVTLTAEYAAGNAKKTVYYNVLVPGKGSSSSSSGGGSGKRDMTVVKPDIPKNKGFEFSDIKIGFWAADEIYYLVERGVISKDIAFRPDDSIKREEFVKMSVELFELVDENAQCNFIDCNKNSWYYKYIASAYEAGIISGMDADNFGVGKPITREDMAVITARILDLKGIKMYNSELTFSDKNDISVYAQNAVAWLSDRGIIKGIGDNAFAPGNQATRAQCAVMLYKAKKL